MNYSDFKGKYYAWIGQMETIGTPNPATGLHSWLGDYYEFATKKERNEYVNDYCDCSGNKNAYKCTAKTGRRFSLGVSADQYFEELRMSERISKDESGNWG